MYTKTKDILVYIFKWLMISIGWKLFRWNDLTDICGYSKIDIFCGNASVLPRGKKINFFVKSSWNSRFILGQLVKGCKLLHCFRELLMACFLWPLLLLWAPLINLLHTSVSPVGDGTIAIWELKAAMPSDRENISGEAVDKITTLVGKVQQH